MPKAAKELLRCAFEELPMVAVWCGYYAGNFNSQRVPEKLGFSYHHICKKSSFLYLMWSEQSI